jgi:hypothetical protein
MHIRFWPALFVFLVPLLAEDNLKFGQPACAGPVLDKQYFVLCYDGAHKVPAWVGYALTQDEAMTKATGRKGSFRADAALPRPVTTPTPPSSGCRERRSWSRGPGLRIAGARRTYGVRCSGRPRATMAP